jgi:lipopolysaccharide export system protein LptA
MDCGLLRIYLAPRDKGGDVEKIFADKSVKIVHTGEKTDAAAPGGKRKTETAIASQQAQLDYKSNKLVFYRNVKVRDEKSTLDCDRLDLFLADRKNQNRKTPAAGGVNTLGGKNKTLTRAIANGSVVMVNNQDEMHTDLMTLVFRDLPEGAKPAPGMLQSGGVQLIKILCDGSVHAFSRDKKVRRMMKSEHAMSDMLKDYSEFHGKVSVYDGNNEVYCRDMYVFTEKSLPESKAGKLPVKKTVSIDADPFALDAGENSVPSRMALSKDIDLKRIVCKKDVELVKKDADGKTQRAGGDQLVYTAATQESVLTAEPPNRPWLRSDGRLQYCDIIRGNMETGDLRGIGSVQVVPDQKP